MRVYQIIFLNLDNCPGFHVFSLHIQMFTYLSCSNPLMLCFNVHVLDLAKYDKGDYTPGASLVRLVLWYLLGSGLVSSFLSPSVFKVFILRIFGASIGRGVRIKPNVKVKFPWRLKVGDNSWIGENVWIDNLAPVMIGASCCISQGSYLCTGNHNWKKESFDLITKSITIEDGVWIAAKCSLAPGITAKKGSVLALGSVALNDLEANTLYRGNPAKKIATR